MKFRSLPVAAAVASLAVPLVGLVPAYADPPAAPDLITVSTTTAGHVIGVAESVTPFVFVGLEADQSDAASLDTSGGSAGFDLLTWGYANLTVHAWACLDNVLDGTCSSVTTFDAGAATDVTLPDGDPAWSADDTVGPTTPATVTIADAQGGGDLVATWTPSVGNPVDTALTRGSDPNPVNLTDGDGTVTIERCSHTTPSQCVPLEPAASMTYHVKKVLGVSSGSPADLTGDHPHPAFEVDTDLDGPSSGAYTLNFHLERTTAPGIQVPGTSPASPVTGALGDDGGTGPLLLLAPSSVPDGTYRVVGTITVINNDYGSYSQVPFTSGTFTIDRTGPSITAISSSQKTIYPLITGLSHYPSSTRFTIVGTGVPGVVAVKLYRRTSAGDTYVRDLTKTPGTDSKHASAVWTGLLPGLVPAPAGQYVVKLGDSDGNAARTVGSVTASGKKLVRKTWTRTYTPGSTFASSYVGKCSTLREPSLRGWYRSFGYYANTRCGSRTSTDSLISTVHSIILPGAVQYLDIRVSAYGGAAKARPGSKAKIRYLHVPPSRTKKAYWVNERTMPATMATHDGYTSPTQGLVFSDHSFAWGVFTGFGYQYEVRSFTVVLHYAVVGY